MRTKLVLLLTSVLAFITTYFHNQRFLNKKQRPKYINTDLIHEQNMVEQESIRNLSEEELLRLDRENLAMKIMLLRDNLMAGEITFKESLKQSVRLIEAYDKNKIEN